MAQTAEIDEFNPLSVKFNGYSCWEEFLLREAEPISFTASSVATTVATGGVNVAICTAQGYPLAGKAMWLEEMSVGLSAPGLAQIEISQSTDTRFANYLKQVIVGAGGLSWSPRRIVRGFLNGGPNLTLNIRNNLTPGSVDYVGTIGASGYRFTDDFNFGANTRVLLITDSTGNGIGPTRSRNMWIYQVKAHLVALGYDVRVILKAVSSSTTTDHEGWRADGYQDIATPALVIYSPGINDAGAGVSDATYVANVASEWNWVKKRWPKAKMIVTGCTPLENDISEARAAGSGGATGHRAAGADFVAGQASPRLKHINLGDAFDRKNPAFYAASDPAGNRVHMNDMGHAAVATTFNTAFDALGLEL